MVGLEEVCCAVHKAEYKLTAASASEAKMSLHVYVMEL